MESALELELELESALESALESELELEWELELELESELESESGCILHTFQRLTLQMFANQDAVVLSHSQVQNL